MAKLTKKAPPKKAATKKTAARKPVKKNVKAVDKTTDIKEPAPAPQSAAEEQKVLPALDVPEPTAPTLERQEPTIEKPIESQAAIPNTNTKPVDIQVEKVGIWQKFKNTFIYKEVAHIWDKTAIGRYLLYALVFLILLSILLYKCADNRKSRIVEKNDNKVAPYEAKGAQLQASYDSLLQLSAQHDSATVDAINYAIQAHAETVQAKDELRAARESANQYLNQQKKSSDENKKAIGDALTIEQLDSIRDRILWTNKNLKHK